MSTLPDLCEFVLSHLDELGGPGGTHGYPDFPKYDLYARDYLSYAEAELQSYTNTKDHPSLINCISHLKRAADCQLDTFLAVLGLQRLLAKRNLGFDKRIEFLSACGIFQSRTLLRFNSMRNRMEHTYEVPVVADLEAYFDLVTAFVAVLEAETIGETSHEFDIGEEDKECRTPGRFAIQFTNDPPLVEAEWDMDGKAYAYSQDTSDFSRFAMAFRAFHAIGRIHCFASPTWMKRELQQIVANKAFQAIGDPRPPQPGGFGDNR